ncbi:MAG: class I tRNA ligase family protein [Myxococcota bacterium]
MSDLYPRIESWVDLVKLEHEVLDFWGEHGVFDRLRAQNAGGEPWSFLDGPITANNPMGVHHAWGRTLKDLYCRYWAMNGRLLRHQNGFDCQGLWVEVEVEKELGFATKRDIAEFGIDKFVRACKERVLTFAARQTEQSVRLGYWMDWDDPKVLLELRDALQKGVPELTVTATSGREVTGSPEQIVSRLGTPELGGSYFTFSSENNYTIWAFLKKCHDEKHLYRGTDVMPWCSRCGTGLSQMEVAEGRKIVEHVAPFVRFPLRGREKEALLVWTTTPWTLTSNVAAAVNPTLDYVKVRHQGWILYLGKAAYEKARERNLEAASEKKTAKLPRLEQLLKGSGEVELLGTLKGSELVGLMYDGPFDHLPAQQIPGGLTPAGGNGTTNRAVDCHRVLAWDMVTEGEGTGIVHIAPGCGAEDAELGRTEGLVALAPLSELGEYVPGFGEYSGRQVSTVSEDILADLKARGLLVNKERYPHVYPHCWRCKEELVFRLVEEWFIDMGWRERIQATVPKIEWIPADGEAREMDWLRNMGDWMISKKRFWGLALPIWVCRDCKAFDVVGSEAELKQRAIAGWDTFAGHTPHRPYVDAVQLRCACGGTMDRIPDVGNPWLDAGIVPYSTLSYTTDRDYWNRWFPAELVTECFPGQFRNWFYAMLSMSAMMEGRPPFKTLLGHGLVRDENGQEMHKSKGNAIWFDDAAEQFGADSMRWLYARQDPVQNLNFGPTLLRDVRGGFLNQLWNVQAFFVNYARLEGYVPERTGVPFAERPDFDRWILSELQDTIAACREAIESHTHQDAAKAIEAFVESLSNWYVRHNRRRFRRGAKDSRSAFETLEACLTTVVGLLAPILPFTAEKLYQNIVRGAHPDAPISVHLTPYPQVSTDARDPALTAEMRALVRITTLALSARESAKLKVRQPLQSLVVGPANAVEQGAVLRFAAMLREDLNVKSVEVREPKTASALNYVVKPDFKALGPKLGDRMGAVVRVIGTDTARILAELRRGAESVTVEVDGDPVALVRGDFLLQPVQPAGQSIAEDRGTWCALSTVITRDLELEGLMRDLLRRLQAMRKELGLEIVDRVALTWDSDNADLVEVMTTWGPTLREDVMADRLEREPGLEAPVIELGGQALRLRMVRVG